MLLILPSADPHLLDVLADARTATDNHGRRPNLNQLTSRVVLPAWAMPPHVCLMFNPHPRRHLCCSQQILCESVFRTVNSSSSHPRSPHLLSSTPPATFAPRPTPPQSCLPSRSTSPTSLLRPPRTTLPTSSRQYPSIAIAHAATHSLCLAQLLRENRVHRL